MVETIEAKTSAAKIYSRELKKDIPFPDDNDAFLTDLQAAAFIGVTTRFLQARRVKGDGPTYIKLSSRCVRTTKRHLIEWGKSHIQTSTSQDKQEVPA